jgi:CMP-N-acetylneuraminic acid synthetase
MRPTRFAQDDTPDRPVLTHMLDWWSGEATRSIARIVYLRPTTPFKTPATIHRCIDTLEQDPSLTCVRTVTRVEGVHHPYWMVDTRDGVLSPFVDGVDIGQFPRRQLLPLCYRFNGVVDVFTVESVRAGATIYGHRIGYVEVDDTEAVDIDRPIDFAWSEFLLNRGAENAVRDLERSSSAV